MNLTTHFLSVSTMYVRAKGMSVHPIYLEIPVMVPNIYALAKMNYVLEMAEARNLIGVITLASCNTKNIGA